jgi:hypothetical protein
LSVKRREVEEGEDRLRLLEDVKKDLREIKDERWREKAGCREELAPVMKEAKALSAP